ncbi:MAG: hypothetical protein HKN36_10650 [Hellea sp.]|nr:hypothetical protein [Hellea sp.]
MKYKDETANYRKRLLRKLKDSAEQDSVRLNIWPIDDGLKIPDFKEMANNP